MTLTALYAKENNLIRYVLYLDNDIPISTLEGYICLIYLNTDVFGVTTEVELNKAVIDMSHITSENTITGCFINAPRIIDLKINYNVIYNGTPVVGSTIVLDLPDKKTLSSNIKQNIFPPDTGDSINQDELLNPVLVHLDFSLRTPLKIGSGELSYSGGGNRYLSNNFNSIVEQPLNTAPWELYSTTFIEDDCVNLIDNNDYAQITGDAPIGFEASTNNVYVTSTVYPSESIDTNNWDLRYRLGDNTYPTIRNTDLLLIDETKPLVCAMLMGITKSSEYLNIKTITLKVLFYNNSDVALGSKDVDYSISDILNTLAVLQNKVAVTDYIVGTKKIKFEVVLKSLIKSDDAAVSTLLPQVTQTFDLSTFIRNATTRVKDILTLPQANNVNSAKGMFIIKLVPNYMGFNPNPNGGYLFDTRDSSGHYGFACRHRADGRFEFLIDIGGVEYPSVSTPTTLTAELVEIKVLWDQENSLRKIVKDGVEIGADFNAFNVPTSLSALIYLGCKTNGSDYIGCQIVEFLIMKTID